MKHVRRDLQPSSYRTGDFRSRARHEHDWGYPCPSCAPKDYARLCARHRNDQNPPLRKVVTIR